MKPWLLALACAGLAAAQSAQVDVFTLTSTANGSIPPRWFQLSHAASGEAALLKFDAAHPEGLPLTAGTSFAPATDYQWGRSFIYLWAPLQLGETLVVAYPTGTAPAPAPIAVSVVSNAQLHDYLLGLGLQPPGDVFEMFATWVLWILGHCLGGSALAAGCPAP